MWRCRPHPKRIRVPNVCYFPLQLLQLLLSIRIYILLHTYIRHFHDEEEQLYVMLRSRMGPTYFFSTG